MDLSSVEDDLVSQIGSVIDNMEVRSFPDNFNNYIQQLAHAGGAILVNLQGASWEEPEGNNQRVLVQNATYTWQCTIIKQNYSRQEAHQGVMDVIETLRTTLSGYTPDNLDDSSVLWPVAAGFALEVHGFYVYQMSFAHEILESES